MLTTAVIIVTILAAAMLEPTQAPSQPTGHPAVADSAEHPAHTKPRLTEREQRLADAIRELEIADVHRTTAPGRDQRNPVGFREVPPEAAALPTLSLRVRREFVGAGEAVVTNETVIRSGSAMFVRSDEGGVEWLFTTNQVDPRRAHGFMVDFERRVILEHDEMDLRSVQIGRDWMDILTLGFDPDARAGFVPGDEPVSFEGHDFEHLVRDDAGVRTEVWWSAELMMPLRIRVSRDETSWTQEIIAIEPVEGTPAEFTPPPQTRVGRMFKTQLLEDWYESHLGCGCGPGSMSQLIEQMRRPGT